MKREPLIRIEAQADATQQETAVLLLLAEGRTAKEAGAVLHVSERTVKNRLADFRAKHQLKNTVQAVAFAARKGII